MSRTFGQEAESRADIYHDEDGKGSGREIVDSVTIGLDIGSSAVRAAEIDSGQGRRVLRRYAQVGLPHGYVVDGEIVNVAGVSEALRRLWAEGGFSKTKVITGISGPRVFVRQADVPALNTEDLRSSLKFDAQELIPIAMEDASFDFSILDDGKGGTDGSPVAPGDQTMRILIVAAHRDVLHTHLAALKGAGLSATAMDAAPLALIRALPSSREHEESSAAEVIVSIGAELTTVAVRQGGVPRFIRSLTVGGDNVTETIANAMHLEMAAAERLKRGAVASESPQLAQARKAMSVELRDLAEDVRGTVDFFMSQTEGSTIDRLLITGGASQTEGLAVAIGNTVSASVVQVDPFSSLTLGDLDLNPDAFARASATATTAIGLALWPVESPLIRLSVLPEEVALARRNRRIVALAATSVAGLAAFLGVVGAGEFLAVHSAQNQVKTAQNHIQALTTQVTQLQAQTAVHEQVQSQAQIVVGTLQGDIDWVRLLGQLAAVMPSNLSLTSFSGSRVAATGGSSSSASSSSSSVGEGTLSFSVKGTGGLPAVAAWLDGLAKDQSLAGTWISGITLSNNGGSVTFGSTSDITSVANSGRAQAVKQ
jgi:type IV pilus assembly protein PilM